MRFNILSYPALHKQDQSVFALICVLTALYCWSQVHKFRTDISSLGKQAPLCKANFKEALLVLMLRVPNYNHRQPFSYDTKMAD